MSDSQAFVVIFDSQHMAQSFAEDYDMESGVLNDRDYPEKFVAFAPTSELDDGMRASVNRMGFWSETVALSDISCECCGTPLA